MKHKERRVKNEETLHLFLGLPTEDVCSLRDINKSMFVRQLKSKVELRVGVPGDLINLFFMNEELLDEKSLHEYNLKRGSVLRLRLHKTWMGLFLACWKGDRCKVFDNGVQSITDEELEELDCDVEQWNRLVVKRATYALFMATHRAHLSLMLELLNSSAADVNCCTVFGRTCLHVAAFQGFVGCVSLLLSEGALPNKADVFGKTPLQLAFLNGHIYCQKRLYLHHTSVHEKPGGERDPRKSAEDTELRTFPQSKQRVRQRHKVMDNVKRNENAAHSSPTSATHERPVFNFPKIPVIPATSPPDPIIHPSSPNGFPVMKIMEHPKNHHSEYQSRTQTQASLAAREMRTYSCPDLQSSVSATSQRKYIPQGIKGIDNILRISQDDIIGEYHNIAESISNVNVTTLKLTLPTSDDVSRCDESERKAEINDDSGAAGYHDAPETSPRTVNKRILGFVLQAEERNMKHEAQIEHEYFERESVDLDKQDVSELSDSRIFHPRLTSSLSYDEWLEKKRESEKNPVCPKSASSSSVEKTGGAGREMKGEEAFQKWLNEKRKFVRRRESSSSSNDGMNRSGSGVSFEIWLSQKRQRAESFSGSFTGCQDNTTGGGRPSASSRGGKSFAEWLSEKRKGRQNTCEPSGNSENLKTRSSHSTGKSFRKWLRDKREEKQTDHAAREDFEIKRLQEMAFLEEKRRSNPRVKTFDEWFEGKRVQKFIEFVQSRNLPDEPTLLSCQTKFPEDAELVFDMWLTSKHMEELSMEEQRYEEMKEKWEKKEQERLQVRNGVLQKLNQMKRGK